MLFYYDLATASTISGIVAIETLLAKQGDAANPFGLESVCCVLPEP